MAVNHSNDGMQRVYAMANEALREAKGKRDVAIALLRQRVCDDAALYEEILPAIFN